MTYLFIYLFIESFIYLLSHLFIHLFLSLAGSFLHTNQPDWEQTPVWGGAGPL